MQRSCVATKCWWAARRKVGNSITSLPQRCRARAQACGACTRRHDCAGLAWAAIAGPRNRKLTGHSNYVHCVVPAPGGGLLTGGADAAVKLWSLLAGGCKTTLTGHPNIVWAVCVLRGSKRVLSGGAGDCVIRLHDLDAGTTPVRTYSGHGNTVLVIIELPGGRFASAGSDNTIRIWEVESGKNTATLSGHSGAVWGLVLLDDDTLLSASFDTTLRWWNLRDNSCSSTTSTPAQIVSALRLADGCVASGHYDGRVRVWDMHTKAVVATLEGHAGGYIYGLSQLPDGRLCSTGYSDSTVRVWDLAAQRCVGFIRAPAGLHRCCTLPDGRLAVACADNSAYLYNVDGVIMAE